MSINVQVLGQPGADNATLLRIDSGSSISRLLFDCGEKCLDSISTASIQSIDHLFFSHFHMDHICGFDTFFRLNYNRPDKPVTIWGPEGTIDVIHHRLRGVTWNLHQNQPGEWIINEISQKWIRTARFHTCKAFEKPSTEEKRQHSNTFLNEDHFSVSAQLLNHGSIPSVAYRIDEPEKENVDPGKLAKLDLKAGPWIREIKENSDPEASIEIDGEIHKVAELRARLLTRSNGDSAAYLTDFILKPGQPEWESVTEWIRGVATMICEAQFCEADLELAEKHSHMITTLVAQLAADAEVSELLLQHVSRRYDSDMWLTMLAEAKAVFKQTSFPGHWNGLKIN